MPQKQTSNFWKWLSWILIGIWNGIFFIRYNPWDFGSFLLPMDFQVYFTARERFLHGIDPYQIADAFPYKYSPSFLLFMKLFPTAEGPCWLVFKAVSLLLFSSALMIGVRYRSRKDFGLLFLGLALSWFGMKDLLDTGQADLIYFSMVIFSGVFWKNRHWVSGILLGVLPWVKIPWVLITVPFFWECFASQNLKKFKNLVSGILASFILIGIILPLSFCGVSKSLDLYRSWLRLLASQPYDLFHNPGNQSLWMSSERWFGPRPWAIISFVAFVGGFLGIRLARKARIDSPLSWLSPWMLWAQALNPLAWIIGSIYTVGIPFSSGFKKRGEWTIWILVAALWVCHIQFINIKISGQETWGTTTLYWCFLLYLAYTRKKDHS